MSEKKWVVYILQSTVSGRFYTGITNDLIKRVRAHNSGKGAKATRAGRPWRIAYVQIMPSKSDALKREHAIKQLTREQKFALTRFLGTSRVTFLPEGIRAF